MSATVRPQLGELSVSNLVAVCRRHLVLLLAWIVCVTVLAGLVIFDLQPRFRAEAMLMIDTRVQQVSNLKSAVSTPFTTADTAPVMRSEVQILNSPELAGKVIDRLNLSAAPSFQDHPGYFGLLRSELRAFCIRVIGSACEPRAVSADAARSRNELISKYLGRLSVFNDGRSFTLSVAFQDTDPKLAAAIVNAHVELYLADQRAFKRRTSVSGVAWIEQQLSRLGVTLASKQQELLALREKSGLIYAKGTTIVAQQVTDINAQLIQARADLAQRQARLSGGGNSRNAAAQSDVLGSPLIQVLRGQEAQARQVLEDVSQRYGPDFPAVLQAQARVAEVQRRLADETARIVTSNDGDVGVANKRVAELERALAALQGKLVSQDQAAARLVEMERDIAGARVVYQGLLERQQELQVQAGTEEADARVVSIATEPLLPFFPNKSMLLSLALLCATVSGLGLVFLVHKPDRGIQLPAQLEQLVSLHALSPIPRASVRRRRHSLPDHLLDQPKSEFAEAIRALRGDILSLPSRESAKVLAVTSALPQEGKTSVAASLARSMVLSGLHVLLVDCDLRRPRVGPALDVRPGSKGLVGVLKGVCTLAEAVVSDSRTSLDLLLVEQSASMPQDLLGSPGFVAMLARARDTYDFVVLDTPPEGAVSDARIVGRQADMILVAVRWNATPPAVVRWTLDAFERHGLPLAGVFLNQVDYPSVIRKDADARTAYKSTRSYYLQP